MGRSTGTIYQRGRVNRDVVSTAICRLAEEPRFGRDILACNQMVTVEQVNHMTTFFAQAARSPCCGASCKDFRQALGLEVIILDSFVSFCPQL